MKKWNEKSDLWPFQRPSGEDSTDDVNTFTHVKQEVCTMYYDVRYKPETDKTPLTMYFRNSLSLRLYFMYYYYYCRCRCRWLASVVVVVEVQFICSLFYALAHITFSGGLDNLSIREECEHERRRQIKRFALKKSLINYGLMCTMTKWLMKMKMIITLCKIYYYTAFLNLNLIASCTLCGHKNDFVNISMRSVNLSKFDCEKKK